MALRDINLVPSEVVLKRLILRHLYLWAGCLVLSIAVVFGLYLFQNRMIVREQRSLAQLKDIQSRLMARIEVQKRLQADQDKMNQQKSALDAIRLKGQPVSHVIARLSEIMNDDTWLSQLTAEAGKDPKGETRLLLAGSSTSSAHLADFLNRLAADRAFKAVTLNFATESEKEQVGQKSPRGIRGKIEFQIGFQLTGG